MATLRDSVDAVSEARPPLSLAAFLVLVVRCCVMGMGHGGGGDAKEVGGGRTSPVYDSDPPIVTRESRQTRRAENLSTPLLVSFTITMDYLSMSW